MVKEDLSHLLSCEWVKERHEVGKLAELVNDDHDAISGSRAGQPFDEVH